MSDPDARPQGLSEPAKGHLAMLVFSGLVAGSFSLGGMMANEIEPVALMAVRFAVAAAIVGAALAATGRLRRAYLAAPWRYGVLGALMAVYFVLMFEALKTSPPVSIATVFALTPLMAAGFGWLVMGQVTTRRMALAIGIAGLGAVWVIFDASLERLLAFHVGRGEALFLVGCVAHALFIPLTPKLRRTEPAPVMTLGFLVAGCLILTVLGARELAAVDWGGLPGVVWAALAYLSLAAGALTFVLVQVAAVRLPSAKVMAYTYLTPVFVILWEGALGHGWPPAGVLAGVAAVVAGLVLLLKE